MRASEAGALGVGLFALGAVIVALLVAYYIWNPIHAVNKEIVEPAAEAVGARQGDFDCPNGFKETSGRETTGEARAKTVTCESPDYIITLRDGNLVCGVNEQGEKIECGLEVKTGRFLTRGEAEALLK